MMTDSELYEIMTLEDLLLEQRKIKKTTGFFNILTAIMIGVAIYGFIKKGLDFLGPSILLLLFVVIYLKNSRKLKQIQAAIDAKR
jgi:chromate transport protein ChrA